MNAAGTLSDPSNAATAVSDNTPPRAVSIDYAPTGRVDASSGRVGRGRVNVTVRVSEPLLTAPFLSVSPSGAAPVAVELAKSTDTEYRGAFDITPTTPSGAAYAVFSARDVVGNRGTEIGTGASLLIDAKGPALAAIDLTPAQPIRNDAAAPVTVGVELTVSEALKPGELPVLAYRLSKPGRATLPVGGITQTGPLAYRASFPLPADAGARSSRVPRVPVLGRGRPRQHLERGARRKPLPDLPGRLASGCSARQRRCHCAARWEGKAHLECRRRGRRLPDLPPGTGRSCARRVPAGDRHRSDRPDRHGRSAPLRCGQYPPRQSAGNLERAERHGRSAAPTPLCRTGRSTSAWP